MLDRITEFRRRRPRLRDDVITLAHGAGGKASAALVDAVFLEAFADGEPGALPDAATLTLPTGERLAFSTDSFVVKPLRFPGRLDRPPRRARHRERPRGPGRDARVVVGRVRDRGGLPGRTSCARSWPTWRRRRGAAGVQIVTGDTKVVGRGAADGLFITTAGRRRDPVGARALPRERAARRRACSCRARSPTTAWP